MLEYIFDIQYIHKHSPAKLIFGRFNQTRLSFIQNFLVGLTSHTGRVGLTKSGGVASFKAN